MAQYNFAWVGGSLHAACSTPLVNGAGLFSETFFSVFHRYVRFCTTAVSVVFPCLCVPFIRGSFVVLGSEGEIRYSPNIMTAQGKLRTDAAMRIMKGKGAKMLVTNPGNSSFGHLIDRLMTDSYCCQPMQQTVGESVSKLHCCASRALAWYVGTVKA